MAAQFPRLSGICRLVPAGSAESKVHFVTKKGAGALPALQLADLESNKITTSYENNLRTVHVLLGEEAQLSENDLRSGTHRAVNLLSKCKAKSAEFVVPTLTTIPAVRAAAVVQQAALLKNYAFTKYLTRPDKAPVLLEELTVRSGDDAQVHHDATIETLCSATIFARDIANERADVANPDFVEEIARHVGEQTGLAVSCLAGEELERAQLNLLSAVGQGARWGPRLVSLEHRGGGDGAPWLMFVGKGITFDTGGLNLKPTGGIESMHLDMGGAAATLAAMRAIAQLRIPRNVVGLLALAENAIGPKAYKPHAIVKSHKGLTVQVSNTDAEGRLALADALSYGQAKYNPTQIVDIATLTGACVVALGEHTAGLFGNNDSFSASVKSAGESVYERVWPMPILPEHAEQLRGEMADLHSTGSGRAGGACVAAAFLREFVDKDRAWAHLDVAGPAMLSKASGHFPAGGTGFGAQLLVNLALSSI